MNLKDLTEEDIKLKYITPIIQKCGYDITTQVRCEYYYTKGKINVRENVAQRSKGKKVDYLLFYRPNIPIAVIEAKDANHEVSFGNQQAIGYSKDLDVPFSYSSNGFGFYEHDMITGVERQIKMEEFPSPKELWNRYKSEKNINEDEEKVITEPYYFLDINKTPRYYQRVAINKTVEAVSKGQNRILLVMATGTGKTFTAFQIVHRLHKVGKAKKILYLADRNILIDQTMSNDFKPFNKVMTKIEHRNMDSSYEIYMSLYHQLKNQDQDIYKQFKPDFFDLIIVDECHRSSAKEDSNWHEILNYFSNAVQIGLTATPKETKDTSNITYFGEPIYTYTLNQGIEDGFLAPYKVLRVSLDKDLEGYRPEKGKLDEDGFEVEDKEYELKDFDRKIVIDERTKVVAKRITEFLKTTDRMSKTIVFCVDTEHALRMRNAIAQENPDMMAKNPNYIVRMTGNDPTGKMQLDNFIDNNSAYPVIATTSQLLSTGVDAKMVKLIVLDREVESMTEFKQIIGRGTRLVENKGKQFFTIMDFRGNTKQFSDPAFDGPAEVVIDVDGGDENTVLGSNDYGTTLTKDIPMPTGGEIIDDRNNKKIYVDGVDVSIINETAKYYDADGKLVTESISDFSKKNLKRLYENYGEFSQEWYRADSKKDFLEHLMNDGIMVDALEQQAENNDIDVFDLLSKVVYDEEAMTKEDRINNVVESNELKSYNDEQRDIIKELLNTYETKNVVEIENIRCLEVPNFSKFGGIVPIITKFGGKEKYMQMINNIKNLLYKEQTEVI
jgi:type I restriction enzyme, R subunit